MPFRDVLVCTEFDTERRVVFGDADRGLLASLERFGIALAFRVDNAGEADLRWFVVDVPLSILLPSAVEVWLVTAAGLEAVLTAEERLPASALSLPLTLPAVEADLERFAEVGFSPSNSLSTAKSATLPLPFLLFDVLTDASSAVSFVSGEGCFPCDGRLVAGRAVGSASDRLKLEPGAVGDLAAMRCFLACVWLRPSSLGPSMLVPTIPCLSLSFRLRLAGGIPVEGPAAAAALGLAACAFRFFEFETAAGGEGGGSDLGMGGSGSVSGIV